MKDVPTMGRPRGPGGRLGVGAGVEAVAVADISRELLDTKMVFIMILGTSRIDFLGVRRGLRNGKNEPVLGALASRDYRKGVPAESSEIRTPGCILQKSVQTIENKGQGAEKERQER
jgi:hypothetical protein